MWCLVAWIAFFVVLLAAADKIACHFRDVLTTPLVRDTARECERFQTTMRKCREEGARRAEVQAPEMESELEAFMSTLSLHNV